MLFSSITFIYYFLPISLIVYFLVSNKYKNLVLLSFSLLFYFLGEPKYIIILVLSCILNYYFGYKIKKSNAKKNWLMLALLYNIGQLLVFKYTDFFIENVNLLFNTDIDFLYIAMPLGISFYTFQGLAYLIDIYKGRHDVVNNLFDFMCYICLFPQLIAGPIVRYNDIKTELYKKDSSYNKIASGITRFVVGLAKKVLLANVLAEFANNLIEVDVLSSWLKPILFTLQIYLDFSGYSDMAIGLGSMFGFTFLENFNYPLISSSVTSFFRRWHISLSSWFKDYVYIPLGGNKFGLLKQIRNILIVWLLTGFWHGASWNFIIWGLYFSVFLILEKLFLKKYLDKTYILKYIYTLTVVVVSFLIFNCNNVDDILTNLANMFMINEIPLYSSSTLYFLKSNLLLLVISILASTPIFKHLLIKLKMSRLSKIVTCLEIITIFAILILVTAFLIDESFNPFLYFRF